MISHRRRQKGSALIAVMLLVILTALIVPQLLNVSTLAQKQTSNHGIKLKNAATAEEINHLIHVSLTRPTSSGTPTPAEALLGSHTENFSRVFGNSTFTQTPCNTSNPCHNRLMANGINLCPQSRFERAAWTSSGKMVVTLACRNGNRPGAATPPSSADAITCDPISSNLSNTTDMRVFTCVYNSGTGDGNLAVSVWSYINLNDRFLKVQEDSF